MSVTKCLFYFLLLQGSTLVFCYFRCLSENKTSINVAVSSAQFVHNDLYPTAIQPNDFLFLDTLLKKKKIVVLGTQQEGEGTTLEWYASLIQHLYQKGYQTLLISSPLFKNWQLDQALKNQPSMSFKKEEVDSLFKKYLPHFWLNSREALPLRTIISENTRENKALHLKGINCDIPTILRQQALYQEILRYLKTHPSFQEVHYLNFKNAFLNPYGPVYYFNLKGKNGNESKKRCLADIKNIIKLIRESPDSSESKNYYMRYLENIYDFFYSKMYIKNPPMLNTYLDSVRFENIRWQIEKSQTHKMVLLCSNAEAANETAGHKNLGYYLKSSYHDEVFTILSTSLEGKTMNELFDFHTYMNPAIKTSLEYQLTSNKENRTFYKIPDRLKYKKVKMRFDKGANLTKPWFSFCDAFLFTKSVTYTNYSPL